MNNWHHGIDSATIEEMKINWYSHRVLRCIGDLLADAFEQVPLEDLVVLRRESCTGEIKWDSPKVPLRIADSETYRLREDWGRPKRKAVIEDEMMELRGNLVLTAEAYNRLIAKTKGWPEGRYRMTLEEM